ncbi:flavoprotein [Nonomuraea longicatena]|uniref:Flavoprotein n=1 Tax=Nonomuraea longicatena TaxID=83682 RepID=A0ABP3ZQU6_9ACTN
MKVLYVVVCAAGPAGQVGRLVGLAQDKGWAVQVIATPSALGFVDVAALERQSGRVVRSRYRAAGEPRSPRADAIVVAPATYNTINKFAQGIADTYALGVLSEAPGLGVPVVVLPFVNSALAARAAFRRSVGDLRADGVRVLFGPGWVEPHLPGSGGERIDAFPWGDALAELEGRYGVVSPGTMRPLS